MLAGLFSRGLELFREEKLFFRIWAQAVRLLHFVEQVEAAQERADAEQSKSPGHTKSCDDVLSNKG